MKKGATLSLFVFFALLLGFMIPGQVKAEEYIVQPGDSLSRIAGQFGTTVEAIAQANDISDPNLIVVGQVLEISAAGDIGMAEAAADSGTVEPGGDSDTLAPPSPMPTKSLVAADFDNCAGTNNLGGMMGAAYNAPDVLAESYVKESGRGCVARLEYDINEWSAFWMQLGGVDLTPYATLNFDIRADDPAPWELKVELKHACTPDVGCQEFSVFYTGGIDDQWRPMSLPLREFGTTGFAPPLSSLQEIDELVFTFERNHSGSEGVVYLDNIRFEN